MNNKETVCAVVVTYNRKKLLVECLEALKKQSYPLDALYLIDNASTDGTPELLIKNNYIDKLPPSDLNKEWEKTITIKNLTNGSDLRLHYVRMHENTGGAGGFHEGIKRAYKKGYDWLWLMDDDSEPKINALKELSNYFNKEDISALWCLNKDINGEIANFNTHIDLRNSFKVKKELYKEYNENSFIEIDVATFIGLIIRKVAIEKIGFPKKELFIHYDDIEYCIRLRQKGKILLIKDSVITHKEYSKNDKIEKRIFGMTLLREPYNKLWILYFDTRNLTWLENKYAQNKIKLYIKLLVKCIISMIVTILCDDNKFKRLKILKIAYLDGLKGNFDNKKPQKILYQ